MAYNPNVPAPDNLVQDDIAAMRENFQHLDPLAQVVDELQTVSGLAPITDDLQAVSELSQSVDELQTVSELAPHVQAILDSYIVEHNLDVPNPPNGYYVRYACGLQICWHRWDQEPRDPQAEQVNRKQRGIVVQFPAQFAVAPAADISQEPAYWRNGNYGSSDSGSSSLSAENNDGNAITTTRIQFAYDLRTYQGKVQFSYKAIGRWK